MTTTSIPAHSPQLLLQVDSIDAITARVLHMDGSDAGFLALLGNGWEGVVTLPAANGGHTRVFQLGCGTNGTRSEALSLIRHFHIGRQEGQVYS